MVILSKMASTHKVPLSLASAWFCRPLGERTSVLHVVRVMAPHLGNIYPKTTSQRYPKFNKFRPPYNTVNLCTWGPYNTRLYAHVFFRDLVLTNRQWMYIFSESLLSSLELSLWPYTEIARSRRASKLRPCYYPLGLVLFLRYAAPCEQAA